MTKVTTLIATDIFGITDALLQLVDELPSEKKILDPYAGKATTFDDEPQAYATFIKQMGHDKYEQLLRQELESIEAPYQLLGFSAGATACWRSVCGEKPLQARQTICIYGSQIRHHCHLQPATPTTVILPVQEQAFDIKRHAKKIGELPNVSVKQTPYLHGFMNKLSPNFSALGYREILSWLQKNL